MTPSPASSDDDNGDSGLLAPAFPNDDDGPLAPASSKATRIAGHPSTLTYLYQFYQHAGGTQVLDQGKNVIIVLLTTWPDAGTNGRDGGLALALRLLEDNWNWRDWGPGAGTEMDRGWGWC